MTKQRTISTGLWARTTKVLGKLWQGVITLPERPTPHQLVQDYPRFPPF